MRGNNMRKILKTILLAGALLGLGIAQAQSVKRHPNDHLHYNVTFADGDFGKITGVGVSLVTNASAPPDQPGAANQFGGQCQKSSDPKTWTCDVLIPARIVSGDYKLFRVDAGTLDFSKNYSEDFHVPTVPIENLNTFTPPSKVTVTEHP
jgi:hypothetical protein